jgi:hypothetical protein
VFENDVVRDLSKASGLHADSFRVSKVSAGSSVCVCCYVCVFSLRVCVCVCWCVCVS